MSNQSRPVSKLVIKACKDNKFSSYVGEFIASINPEKIDTKSKVGYHTQSWNQIGSLNYRGVAPQELSFTLLLDGSGIIPGSSPTPVMDQIKHLKDVIYNKQKSNNAPNYLRVIWGEQDFTGRLIDLVISYTNVQVDGKFLRATAAITILEELPLGAKVKSQASGKDSERAQASHANAVSKQPNHKRDGGQDTFKQTPDGPGAYSGAPEGAYDGKPDTIYYGPANNNKGVGAHNYSQSGEYSRPGDYSGSGSRLPGGAGATAPKTDAMAPHSMGHRTIGEDKLDGRPIGHVGHAAGPREGSTSLPQYNNPAHTTSSLNKDYSGHTPQVGSLGSSSTNHNMYAIGGGGVLAGGVAGAAAAGAVGKAKGKSSMYNKSGLSRLKRRPLPLKNFSANLNVNSLKDKAANNIKKHIPKLSLWQRAKLFAAKVMLKYKP